MDLGYLRQEEKEKMKCVQCRNRGERNPPNYEVRQHRDSKDREELFMKCPKCGHVYPQTLIGKRR